MNKMYGLTGETVKAKLKRGTSDAYPWEGMEVPIKITAEYPNFLVGTVLSHKQPKGFRTSQEYTVTLDKHDIATGEMILNGGSIR